MAVQPTAAASAVARRPSPAWCGRGGGVRGAVSAGRLANVELGLQGQGDGAPVGVLGQGGQGDPDVAVDVLLAGGARAGVVMDAGTLDLGAIAWGGRVVDGHRQAWSAQQRLDGEEGANGHVRGLAADGPDGGVGRAEVVGDTGGAEPGGDGAASAGEEDAEQQQGQAEGGAAVQPGGQAGEGAGQQRWQVRQWHGRLLGGTTVGRATVIVFREPACVHPRILLCASLS